MDADSTHASGGDHSHSHGGEKHSHE
jgi:hypothetical protein